MTLQQEKFLRDFEVGTYFPSSPDADASQLKRHLYPSSDEVLLLYKASMRSWEEETSQLAPGCPLNLQWNKNLKIMEPRSGECFEDFQSPPLICVGCGKRLLPGEEMGLVIDGPGGFPRFPDYLPSCRRLLVDECHAFCRHILGHYGLRGWPTFSMTRDPKIALRILFRKQSGIRWEWDDPEGAAFWLHIVMLPCNVARLDTGAPPPPEFLEEVVRECIGGPGLVNRINNVGGSFKEVVVQRDSLRNVLHTSIEVSQMPRWLLAGHYSRSALKLWAEQSLLRAYGMPGSGYHEFD